MPKLAMSHTETWQSLFRIITVVVRFSTSAITVTANWIVVYRMQTLTSSNKFISSGLFAMQYALTGVNPTLKIKALESQISI